MLRSALFWVCFTVVVGFGWTAYQLDRSGSRCQCLNTESPCIAGITGDLTPETMVSSDHAVLPEVVEVTDLSSLLDPVEKPQTGLPFEVEITSLAAANTNPVTKSDTPERIPLANDETPGVELKRP